MLRFFNLSEPLSATGPGGEVRSSMDLLRAAAEAPGAHVDIGMAASWDTPLWVASGLVDSICLADEQLGMEGTNRTSESIKPADPELFPPPLGAGRWAEKIYYRLLDCGIQLPPSAGSGSGTTPNPVGYNRVYVQTDGDFNCDAWWSGLQAGHVFISNGPLLRARGNGYYPGHVFASEPGESVEITITANLATRDPIEYFEIIRDGRPVEVVRLQEWAEAGGQLPPLVFEESGWFLVRAVTSNEDTYRYATTAPFYVDIGKQPRISRYAAQFFLDWMDERIAQLESADQPIDDAVMADYQAAREFWQAKLDAANAN